MKRTLTEIRKEIKELEKIDNQTSDRVQHELNVMDEKEKELTFALQRMRTEYHKLKSSDLPLYAKQEWKIQNYETGIDENLTTWLYKLSIVEGRLLCQRLEYGKNKPYELHIDNIGIVAEEKVKEATEEEWTTAVSKLLTQLDKPTK